MDKSKMIGNLQRVQDHLFDYPDMYTEKVWGELVEHMYDYLEEVIRELEKE